MQRGLPMWVAAPAKSAPAAHLRVCYQAACAPWDRALAAEARIEREPAAQTVSESARSSNMD